MRYAIGEILLVVIGILLALQINTWKKETQNRKLERLFKVLKEALNKIDHFNLFKSQPMIQSII